MLIQDLEQATLDFIRTIFNVEYTGKIKVSKIDPIGYEVVLYPQGELVPMVIYGELDDTSFLKYLKQELRTKNFHLSTYGQLNKREPVICNPISKSCSCNDIR